MKKISMLVVLLWIHSSRQVGYILEKFENIGIMQHIEKK